MTNCKTEISALRHSEECLNAVIKSINRKLEGGSAAVTSELLDARKLDLTEVETKLLELGESPRPYL